MAKNRWSLAVDGAAAALAATGATVVIKQTDAERVESMPLLNLAIVNRQRRDEVYGVDIWDLTLEIGIYVTAKTGEALEEARLDMAAKIELAMSADLTLGSICQDNRLIEGDDLPEEVQDAGPLYSDWAVFYRLTVETAEGDPFTAL